MVNFRGAWPNEKFKAQEVEVKQAPGLDGFWRLPEESIWPSPDIKKILGQEPDALTVEIYKAVEEMSFKDKDEWLRDRFFIWRDYIKHEDGLINNRITWFVSFHSFLIAAFGLVLTTAISTLFAKNTNLVGLYVLIISAIFSGFLTLIIVVGLQTAHSTYFSVMAAASAIQNLEEDWSLLLKRLTKKGEDSEPTRLKMFEAMPGITGGGDVSNNERGIGIAARLPRLIHGLWRFLLVVPALLLVISGCLM